MPHSLPAHFRLNDLYAALLTNHATVLHTLVLAAVALVVLDRTKDLRAEKPIPLRLECPVVNGFGLLHLTE